MQSAPPVTPKRKFRYLGLVALFAFLSLSPFAYLLSHPDRFLGTRDTLRILIPFRFFELDSWIKFGAIPRWNPYAIGGIPFRDELVGGSLDPLNFIFVLMGKANFFYAESWYFALRLPIAFVGLYAYFRSLRARRASSLLFAFCFSISAFYVCATSLSSVSLMPLYFAGLLNFLREGRLRHAVLAAASLSYMVYQGGPDFALFTALASPAICWRELAASLPARAQNLRSFLRNMGKLAFTGGLACLFAAPLLVPYWHLHRHSGRAMLSEGNLLTDPFHPLRLLELCFADLWGNFHPTNTYVAPQLMHLGIDYPLIFSAYLSFALPSLLLLSLTSAAQRRRQLPLLIATLLLFAIALGEFGGLYGFLLRHWSLWRLFRYPEKWLALAILPLMGIAIRGWERLTARIRRRDQPVAAFLLPSVMALVVFIAFRRFAVAEASVEKWALMEGLFAALVALAVRGRIGARVFYALVFLAMATDHLGTSINYIWDQPVDLLGSPSASAIQADIQARAKDIRAGGAYRVISLGKFGEINAPYIPPQLDFIGRTVWLSSKNMVSNTFMLYGLSSASVYPELGGQEKGQWWHNLSDRAPQRLLDLMSVYYIQKPLPDIGFTPNPNALPFVMPIQTTEPRGTFESALERVRDPSWDPARSTVIEAAVLPALQRRAVRPVEVERGVDLITIYTPSLQGNSLLLVNESFAPEWSCRPDCEVLARANGWAMAVRVDRWTRAGITLAYKAAAKPRD